MYKVKGVAVVGANEHGEKSGLEDQLRRGNRKQNSQQPDMWQGGNSSF
jgi:hypothetical protein